VNPGGGSGGFRYQRLLAAAGLPLTLGVELRTYTDMSAWHRVSQAPLILRAYVAFALVASALAMSPLYAPTLNAAIVPYCGWSGLMIYMFTLFFAIAACQDSQRKSLHAVVWLLMLGVFYGAIDTMWHTLGPGVRRPNFDNPYSTYNSFRPLITMALPALWGTLLVSPRMRKWINNS